MAPGVQRHLVSKLHLASGDVLVRRGEIFPAAPTSGPIYVCTRNDALAGVIASTPSNRREDLVFLQNGMVGEFLFEQGLRDAAQVTRGGRGVRRGLGTNCFSYYLGAGLPRRRQVGREADRRHHRHQPRGAQTSQASRKPHTQWWW